MHTQQFQQLDCLLGLLLRVPLYGYGGYRQVVKASGCDSDMREFDPHYPPQGDMT